MQLSRQSGRSHGHWEWNPCTTKYLRKAFRSVIFPFDDGEFKVSKRESRWQHVDCAFSNFLSATGRVVSVGDFLGRRRPSASSSLCCKQRARERERENIKREVVIRERKLFPSVTRFSSCFNTCFLDIHRSLSICTLFFLMAPFRWSYGYESDRELSAI